MTEETAGTVHPSIDALPGRVTSRRHELGLSVEDMARRTGLPRAWVDSVESGSTPPSAPALSRLADALETTVDDLLSASPAGFTHRVPPRPPGQGPGPGRELVEMNDEECQAHLLLQLVGRVAVPNGPDPFVLPVNYVMLGRDVMFCTAADSVLAGVEGPVLFEVDEILDAARIGWSVLIRGTAERDRDPTDAPSAAEGPWPADHRDVCIRIRAERVTGRRLRPTVGEGVR
ncbi:helix-turn-helix domain-containing protein [Embleya scabrispora]|uniref:helix-turn-helix domain-containing protein n=1 Tax=Embleya scabrispora TaxID=159449 RepID=UPI00037932E8|nr:pyridoxamine 5'-phosphate oxidase family protein [Embleya scabrispora]MYS87595.1 helix-turn-helix domain-containing protein [Streptomyces sp. SID5474]